MAANSKQAHPQNKQLFIFYTFILFSLIAKKTIKNNRKIFLIVIKNRSRLAAIYVGDNLVANRRHQTLLLL